MTDPTDSPAAGAWQEAVKLGADALRALAHPLRVRLVREVSRKARARTSDLAAAIGEPANKTSYHLRQLVTSGILVQADPPAGSTDGRESWWRLASDGGLTWDPTDPAVTAVAADLERLVGAQHARTLQLSAALNTDRHLPSTVNDFNVPLTRAEAEAFEGRLRAVADELFALRLARLGTAFPAEVEYDLAIRFLPVWEEPDDQPSPPPVCPS